MAAKVYSFNKKVIDVTNQIKDGQIAAAEGELDKILGAIQGWEQGVIKSDSITLLDLIKNDILQYFGER
jgi:hypothetical protein